MAADQRTQRLAYWTCHPERRRAAWRVWYHRRRGLLVRQPCWSCDDPNTEAHHPVGYRGIAALLVVWLCGPCHRRAHRRVS